MSLKKIPSIIALFILSLTCFSTIAVNAYVLLQGWTFSTSTIIVLDNTGYSETPTAVNNWNSYVLDARFSLTGLPFSHHIGMVRVNNPGVGWDGATTPYFDIWGHLYKMKIEINHATCGTYASWVRRSVIAHELGHGFSLGDQYFVPVLMNGATWGFNSRCGTFGIFTPQADDRAGVNAAY